MNMQRAFRVGVAGPVGSGKTALVDVLSRRFWPAINLAVVTNDIYTREDAEFLIRQGTLPADRVRGVGTGGCPPPPLRGAAPLTPGGLPHPAPPHPRLALLFHP